METQLIPHTTFQSVAVSIQAPEDELIDLTIELRPHHIEVRDSIRGRSRKHAVLEQSHRLAKLTFDELKAQGYVVLWVGMGWADDNMPEDMATRRSQFNKLVKKIEKRFSGPMKIEGIISTACDSERAHIHALMIGKPDKWTLSQDWLRHRWQTCSAWVLEAHEGKLPYVEFSKVLSQDDLNWIRLYMLGHHPAFPVSKEEMLDLECQGTGEVLEHERLAPLASITKVDTDPLEDNHRGVDCYPISSRETLTVSRSLNGWRDPEPVMRFQAKVTTYQLSMIKIMFNQGGNRARTTNHDERTMRMWFNKPGQSEDLFQGIVKLITVSRAYRLQEREEARSTGVEDLRVQEDVGLDFRWQAPSPQALHESTAGGIISHIPRPTCYPLIDSHLELPRRPPSPRIHKSTGYGTQGHSRTMNT